MKDTLGVVATEVPVDPEPVSVDAVVPGGCFPLALAEIGNAAFSEALAGVQADPDLGLIQPASCFGV